jgi:hypothetical protein
MLHKEHVLDTKLLVAEQRIELGRDRGHARTSWEVAWAHCDAYLPLEVRRYSAVATSKVAK